MDNETASRIDLEALERETGLGSNWFIALGIGLITLGGLAFANLPEAAEASVNVVGIFMLVAAFAKLGTVLLAPDWRGRGHLALSALLYGVAGIAVIFNAGFAATALTLTLALALILSGAMRIWLSVVMPYLPGWGWIGASGLDSVAAGAVFIALWPDYAVWLLGVVLACDLTFQGVMMIAFAIGLKAASADGRQET